jgi:hypothetical protein
MREMLLAEFLLDSRLRSSQPSGSQRPHAAAPEMRESTERRQILLGEQGCTTNDWFDSHLANEAHRNHARPRNCGSSLRNDVHHGLQRHARDEC